MRPVNTAASIRKTGASTFTIHPNPSSDKITIETTVIPKKGQFSFFNMQGREIITCQITESKTQLDITALPSGVYFVRLTGDRTVQGEKFVKH